MSTFLAIYVQYISPSKTHFIANHSKGIVNINKKNQLNKKRTLYFSNVTNNIRNYLSKMNSKVIDWTKSYNNNYEKQLNTYQIKLAEWNPDFICQSYDNRSVRINTSVQ